MTPPILYDIAIEPLGDREMTIIDWGHTPRWMETYREELDSARALVLTPKDGADLPSVRVELGGDKRWVVFSRVAGHVMGGAGQLRIYCIGWQRTVRGESVKSLTWVYPGGVTENAEEPTLIDVFMGR